MYVFTLRVISKQRTTNNEQRIYQLVKTRPSPPGKVVSLFLWVTPDASLPLNLLLILHHNARI